MSNQENKQAKQDLPADPAERWIPALNLSPEKHSVLDLVVVQLEKNNPAAVVVFVEERVVRTKLLRAS